MDGANLTHPDRSEAPRSATSDSATPGVALGTTKPISSSLDEAIQYSFTLGHDTQSVWTDVRCLRWSDLAVLLTTHHVGPKKGSCIVPATFSGQRRHKSDAQRIDVVFLDSDAGASMDEISSAVAKHGWAAVISSTHSHLSSRTRVKRSNWDKFQTTAADKAAAPAAFLQKEKGFLPHIAAGASVAGEDVDHVTFEHQPCPKFRIAIPLLHPWLAADYENQGQANAAWKERIEALASALSLDHDQSCTDTSRLFYLPRRPTDGPLPETRVLQGQPCDLFSLPSAPTPVAAMAALGASGQAQASVKEDTTAKIVFEDPDTKEHLDLRAWARTHASRFEMVKALHTRRPSIFVGKVAGGTKHHIRCVNEDQHTNVGSDFATIVINAGESSSKGFVYHCRHAHCDGVDRLLFLRQMLEQGWLRIGDLTASEFLSDRKSLNHVVPGIAGGCEKKWLEIGSDAEIGFRVREELVQRFNHVVFDDGEFWYYNQLHWETISTESLWCAVFAYDGARFYTPTGEPSNVKLSKGRVESILACMKPLLWRRRFFAEAAAGINCSSGFISFAADGTPSLVAHSPDHRHRHVIAGHWPCNVSTDVKATSLLHRLLHGCFQNDHDSDAKMDLLAEVAGIAALGQATRIVQPKALICVGKQAENGKSQMLAMLRSLLPKSAVSVISPARFADRTFACHLVGKLLNAPDELAGTDAIASDMFKQIITGDPISVRDVYRSAFEFEPCAQHVYATNTLPVFKDGMDRGVRRRLLVLTFNRVIPKEERLERIGQRVGEEEADLLLDWAVRGAARLIATQAFTTPASSTEALRDWMYSSDPVLAWLESGEVEFGQSSHVPETRVSVAHDKFHRWASEEGFCRDRLPAVNSFSQRVEAAGKGVTKKRTSEGARFVGLGCTGAGTDGGSGLWRR
ncbi:hypothetical protein E2C06_20080 [Dankookia rubra]|uniref:SF3 helicase domain-containing protein n=1 Tax=Dankookia rubra TaxID=1442381 RepID=A0A4R5QDS6_9PROT|nr:DUF5906 domain-containing protein [Dankookia rubra]TDH60799.1 hypothetical protein E2C06_20080 [Dankookia rubra]